LAEVLFRLMLLLHVMPEFSSNIPLQTDFGLG